MRYCQNPWHDVPTGAKAPRVVNAIIEIPTGSKAKYELDKESGLLKLDRVLFSAVHYPANYGFIPQTYCEDHDPLDILVICSVKLEPLCLVEARVLGVMNMVDGGEADDKIIAVANSDNSLSHIERLDQLPQHVLDEVHRFFEDYKKLEKKTVVVEHFKDREEAWRVVDAAIKMYDTDIRGKQHRALSPRKEEPVLDKPAA